VVRFNLNDNCFFFSRMVLSRILYLIHTGVKFHEKELENLFFGVTKLFYNSDVCFLN
jgi:hypothetical protein